MKKLVVALALTAVLTVAGTALSGGTARFYAQNTTRSLNKLNAALNPLFTRKGWIPLGCQPTGGDPNANVNAYGKTHGYPGISCLFYFASSPLKVAARVTFTAISGCKFIETTWLAGIPALGTKATTRKDTVTFARAFPTGAFTCKP